MKSLIERALILFLVTFIIPVISVSMHLPSVEASGGSSSVQGSIVSLAGTPFNGVGLGGGVCSGCVGPATDTEIAVGGQYIIEWMAFWANVYLKSNHSMVHHYDYMEDLFGIPRGQNCDGDMRFLFDSQTGAWFAEFLSPMPGGSCSGSWIVAIAVNTSPDPTQPWTVYWITETNGGGPSGGAAFPDHPEIAVSSDKLVITANMYSNYNPLYWLIRKSDLVSRLGTYVLLPGPQPSGFNCQDTQVPDQIVPVKVTNPSSTIYLICIGHRSAVHTPQLFSVDGSMTGNPPSLTGPTLLKVFPDISESDQPTGFQEPGGGSLSPPNDPTFTQDAYMSQNVLWYAVGVNCGTPTACIHLTSVDMSSTPPAVQQDFDWSVLGKEVYLPRLIVDGNSDLALIFGYMSQSDYPNLALAGQGVGDAQGQLTPYVPITSGLFYDPTRLQDYFGISPDPSDPSLVWAAGSYWPTNDNWATEIASFRINGFAMSANPSSLNIYPGTVVSTTVTVQSLRGFTAAVTFSTQVSPNYGETASVSPASVQLNSGSSNSTTATITGTHVLGGYTMVVYAQSQGITLALNVNFRIAYFDFSMTASPTSLEIATEYCCAQSATSTLTLTLAPLDAGQPVSFSAQGQPSYLQIGYNPSSVIPTNSVTVTFTVPAGGKIYSTRTYNIVITGSWTSSDQTVTISHSINVSVTIDQDCTRSYCFNKPPP